MGEEKAWRDKREERDRPGEDVAPTIGIDAVQSRGRDD